MAWAQKCQEQRLPGNLLKLTIDRTFLPGNQVGSDKDHEVSANPASIRSILQSLATSKISRTTVPSMFPSQLLCRFAPLDSKKVQKGYTSVTAVGV
jgi:hypothetical protein